MTLRNADEMKRKFYDAQGGERQFYEDAIATGRTSRDLGVALVPANKIVSYTLTVNDHIVVFNATTLTATLPTAVGCRGKLFIIKNLFAGNLTVATTAAETVDATTPAVIATLVTRRYLSDGANWLTL